MKKIRGHFCWVCGRIRPNQRFNGRGHRRHICKECQSIPREELERITLERELERYLSQSHISDGNLSRLGSLAQHADPAIREHAALLYDIGIATPYKRRRFKRLAREHRDLLTRFYAIFGRADFPNAENEWLAMMEVSLESEDVDDMDDMDYMEYWGEIDEEEEGFVQGIEVYDPFADEL